MIRRDRKLRTEARPHALTASMMTAVALVAVAAGATPASAAPGATDGAVEADHFAMDATERQLAIEARSDRSYSERAEGAEGRRTGEADGDTRTASRRTPWATGSSSAPWRWTPAGPGAVAHFEAAPVPALVHNPSFDIDAAGWTAHPDTDAARVVHKAHTGLGSLEISARVPGEAKAWSDRFAVDASLSYSFTAQVAAGDVIRTTGLQIDWFTDSDAYISSAWQYLPSTTSFARRTITNTRPPESAAFARVAVVVVDVDPGEAHYVDTITAHVSEGGDLPGGASAAPDHEIGELVSSDTFSGSSRTGYISSSANASNPMWFGESGSDPVHRVGGVGDKSGTTRFFRMWTQEAVGGPGNDIRIKARVRTDSIYVRDSGGIVEGTKMWLKWAHDRDEAGAGPASVRGIVDGTSPGSYIYSFHTHNGSNEVMKRAAGQETSSAYTFFDAVNRPYQLGTWENIEMTFEWLPDALRIRSYRNGALQMEVMDAASNRMMVPGYAGIRADDSTFQIDDFTIESF